MRSTWRGHSVYLDCNKGFRYEDTDEKTVDAPRRYCGFCELKDTPEGHDGCLGTLPGVMNACCGHGNQEHAYVQYQDRILRGEEAVAEQRRLKLVNSYTTEALRWAARESCNRHNCGTVCLCGPCSAREALKELDPTWSPR